MCLFGSILIQVALFPNNPYALYCHNRWPEFTVGSMEADYDLKLGIDDEERVMNPVSDWLTKHHLTYKL